MKDIEFKGAFLGKQLYRYDPEIDCTENDFKHFATQFNRIETLRSICSISSQLFSNKDKHNKLGEVPVGEAILLDLAYRVIKYCNDNKQSGMNDDQLKIALRMCHKLFDANFTKTHKNAQEILTIIAYRQFIFQENIFNNFARNYYIFTDLWYRTPISKDIDILAEIESEIGTSYENSLFFAYALVGNKDGHFWIYDEEKINEFNAKTKITFQLDSHEKFVKWCSGDYETILKGKLLLPPFVIHPIIETKTKPTKKDGEVFMIASPHYIHDKVTYGLYFTLINRFNKGGCNNKFKELFGIVFQEYVGELLKFYFKTWEIIPEIKYKKGKHNFQDSIDWFILKDDKLIMIEVKQSSLFLKSKYDPSSEKIKSNLRKTVIKGVQQLEVSETDIKSKKYLDLQKFNNVKSFVKLVVVNDPIYNANFIVKTLMKDEVDNLNFQVININELETLLSNQKNAESLFDTLYFKGMKYNEMDFKEFIIAMFPDPRKRVEFLEPIWDRFFSKVESHGNKIH